MNHRTEARNDKSTNLLHRSDKNLPLCSASPIHFYSVPRGTTLISLIVYYVTAAESV